MKWLFLTSVLLTISVGSAQANTIKNACMSSDRCLLYTSDAADDFAVVEFSGVAGAL